MCIYIYSFKATSSVLTQGPYSVSIKTVENVSIKELHTADSKGTTYCRLEILQTRYTFHILNNIPAQTSTPAVILVGPKSVYGLVKGSIPAIIVVRCLVELETPAVAQKRPVHTRTHAHTHTQPNQLLYICK